MNQRIKLSFSLRNFHLFHSNNTKEKEQKISSKYHTINSLVRTVNKSRQISFLNCLCDLNLTYMQSLYPIRDTAIDIDDDDFLRRECLLEEQQQHHMEREKKW